MQKHLNYYIVETFILGLGFFGISFLSGVSAQAIALCGLIALYMIMGIIHHRLKHDLHFKIVLEYVIIGSVVFAVFIFFKSGVV